MAIGVKNYRATNGMILHDSYHHISKISFAYDYTEELEEIDENTFRSIMVKVPEQVAVVQVHPDEGARRNLAQAVDHYIVDLTEMAEFTSENIYELAYGLVSRDLSRSEEEYEPYDIL